MSTFLLITLGSYGDVHPFIGLGRTLLSRGHRVKLLASPYFQSLADREGLELVPLGTVEDYLALSSNPLIWHPRKGGLVIIRYVMDSIRTVYDAIMRHADDRAVLVASTLAIAARVAHERERLSMVSVHLSPVCFRSVIQPPRLPGMPNLSWWPKWMIRKIWEGADRFFIDPQAQALNDFRRELGLPPVNRIMNGWWNSPQLVLAMFPEWFAPPQPDWPSNTQCVGFGRYDEADISPMPEALVRFLDAGDPPIAFTPGSAMMHGQRFFQTAVETCRRLGRRGVLLSRHRGHIPTNLPEGILHIDYAPFSKLLPRCCALVHHGGIGTTAQGLAAGIPQVVMALSHDQFDNAARLERLGVGRMLTASSFTPRRLSTRLLELLSSPSSRTACTELAGRLRHDNALDRAAALLENLTAHSQARPGLPLGG